jgi:segregation and condensation protein B
VRTLADRYEQQGRGFRLREIGGGWRLYTAEQYADVVERYVLDGQTARLSQAALETLAIVAYQQPVARSRVASIRGVSADGVMRTLVVRGLVREVDTDPQTGAVRYGTTRLFLEKLGLRDLSELPPLAPLLPEAHEVASPDPVASDPVSADAASSDPAPSDPVSRTAQPAQTLDPHSDPTEVR